MNIYKCNLCGQDIERDSDKKWISSICKRKNKETRIYLKSYLKNEIRNNRNRKPVKN